MEPMGRPETRVALLAGAALQLVQLRRGLLLASPELFQFSLSLRKQRLGQSDPNWS